MMPLTLASVGEENIIRKVGGNPEVKKHLEQDPAHSHGTFLHVPSHRLLCALHQ